VTWNVCVWLQSGSKPSGRRREELLILLQSVNIYFTNNRLPLVMNGYREGSDQRDHASKEELPSRFAEDQFYQAMASTPRRRILHHLLTVRESTVEELTSVLSGWEVTTAETTMHTPEDRSAIKVRLVHNHLPTLADAELIDYEPDSGVVQVPPLNTEVKHLIRQSVAAESNDEAE